MLKGKPWQIALGALGAMLLIAGQVAIIQSQYSKGAALSAAGVLCAAAAFILPLVPWGRALGLARELFSQLLSLAVLLKRRKAAVAAPAGKSRPAPGRAKASLAVVARQPWRPFASDTLVLSRHLLAIPIFLLALAGYFGAVAGQRMVMGIAALVALLLLMTVYLQDLERPMSFPSMNQNFKSLLKLCLGLPFQILGFSLLWGYRYVYTGYLLVVVGSAIMIAVLMLSKFNLVEDEAATSSVLDYFPETPWWTSSRLIVKSTLVAAAAISAYAAEELAGKQAGFSVTAGFLAIGLLVLSFPWLPFSLADWEKIPQLPRTLATLGFASIAFMLGVKGQALIDAGNVNGGLWRFLFAGIILVLTLPRLNRPLNNSEVPRVWSLRLEMLLVLVLFLAALQLRVFNLETFPYGAEGDEAGGGMFAVEALKGKVDNALVTANVPLHYYSITSIFFKIFGLSLAAMRAHAVIFGVISILTTYFFVRLFYGVLIALLISFLMNFSYWHLHYSRFGHYNIEQVAMQMAAFYFVFKAMKGGKLWNYVAGGMAFGFAMLPHLASRMLPLAGIALILYFFMTRRDLLRRHLPGFFIFVIASWMIAAPCLTYWFRAIPASLGRAQSVSIFDKTNSNAPVDTLSGFVHNCKISMMMFNQYSDSRTRNNPVAPQKILENWTAILFAIAFAYMLYHWRDPLAFFMLTAFFINLAASIFSVEAPQTLRTAGNISIVYCMIAFLLYDFKGAFELLNRRAGAVLFALILVPAIGFFSYRSWQKYFVEARNLTFDAVPTYVAGVAGTKGSAADQAVFFATGFASSHPPVLLFAQDTPIRNFYNASDYLPVSLVSNKTHLLFFCDSFEGLTPWVQTLYPGVKPASIPHLTAPGQNLGTYFIVPSAEIAAHLGLEAVVDGRTAVKNAPLGYPSKEIPSATGIHWKGSVRFENYGLYTFSASGRGDCQLRLAGQLAYSRHGASVAAPELRLPMGLLPLEADFKPSAMAGREPFSISWVAKPHPARMLYSFKSTSSGTLEKRQLFDYPVQGFYGQYYVSKEFKGDSVMEYVEPTVLAHWLDSPLPGNWSAVWKAKFKAPLSGAYRFSVSTFGSFAEVRVDGKIVHRGGSPPIPELHPPFVAPAADIKAGEHDLEVRFFTAGPSWYELRVTMPGQPDQLMPPMMLRPVYPHF